MFPLGAEIIFQQPWPWGVFFAVLGVLVAIFALLYSTKALELERNRRLLLMGLRILTVVLIFICLARPAIRKVLSSEHDPSLVVAVDVSRSMSIEDYDGPRSRLDTFKRSAAKASLIEKLGKRYVLRFFEFDHEARESAVPAELKIKGDRTDLAHSMEDLAQKVDINTIGVVLVSDGADNADGEVLTAAEAFEQRGIPLLTVGLGTEELRDLEISSISIRRIVRMNTTVELNIKLKHQGYPHHLLPVQVKRAGQVVTEKEVALQDEITRVEFEFTPMEEGMLRYTVEIPPQAGEVILENNRRDFSINASRRKIRVLYMEGSQYKRQEVKFWEYQFLVQALLEDKDVKVTPLFREDVRAAAEAGIGYMLHPDKGFPRTRKKLFEYDVVISSDIDIGLFTEGQLKNLVDFVGEFGGGFVMVGGWTSFGAGGYDESVVDQMLPVDMLGRQDRYTENVKIRWEVTPEGFEHPIMRLVDDPAKNRAIWKSMPNFYGYNNVLRSKPAATTLTIHPTESTAYGRRVLLAVQHYGKGRSMAFMPDTTAGWGKDFEEHFGEGGDNRYFKKFWKNAVRWLAAYRIHVPNQLVTIQTDQNLYERGEPARIEVSVLDAEYQPSRDAEVELEIKFPDGEVLRRRLAPDLQHDGQYPWDVPTRISGEYELSVRARDAKGLIDDDRAAFEVQSSSKEFRNYALNRSLLTALSAQTHGKYYSLDQLPDLLPDLIKTNRKTLQTEISDLWEHPLIYALLLVLLSTEWIARKKLGLL